VTAFEKILCKTPKGLYCPPGDFYVDPTSPVARAVITHGHSDHARSGHGSVLATAETIGIMSARYGAECAGSQQAVRYGETISINGVSVRLVPAGHVLGSAQAVVEHAGKRMVVSGDYKRRRDPTCPPFEPVPCDVFITEATFALPVFRHPDDREEIAKLLKSVAQFPERTHIIGCYALGKAQRVIKLLREAGYEKPIYLHGAMEALCALYERFGVSLGPLEPATVSGAAAKAQFAGEIVIAPPSAFQERWARRFQEPLPAFASGWMRIRQRAKQQGVELPLILSDHADWDELTSTVEEIQPQEVWVTHGRDDALLRWAKLKGLKARPLHLIGYEDEND
jgi:putative mRNA 3-end processing factor